MIETETKWKVLSPSTNEGVESVPQRVILLYGPSGCGKTRLAAQFPDPLVLACDPGTLGGLTSAMAFGPKYEVIKDYQKVLTLLDALKRGAGTEFKTLIIDSASYLARTTMSSILQTVHKEIPRFEEWGLLAERMRKLFITFTSLPVNVIFTAIDTIQKDEITGKLHGGPDLPGKLSKELPQACDVVARLSSDSSYSQGGKKIVSYKYTVVGDSTYIAKDRTDILEKEGKSEFKSFEPLFKA